MQASQVYVCSQGLCNSLLCPVSTALRPKTCIREKEISRRWRC